MPLVQSTYKPPFLFRSAHLQTIYPALFRKVPLVTSDRERITTPDGDFLDLDWNIKKCSKRLVILTHGLEGNSRQAYMQGMARVFSIQGWNVLSWNFRGCSGEINRYLQSYHSGATEELQTILGHVFKRDQFSEIALVGFSLGGNVTLKYLGDRADSLDTRIKSAVAISVPCDLKSSSLRLEDSQNRIYMERFMKTLRTKIREKMERFPGQLDDTNLDKMKTFREFDGGFTAPIHGFTSAEDYWARSSSKPVLKNIIIPTLLINAADDPFLAEDCYPMTLARESDRFHLEIPFHGGHVGFIQFGENKTYYSERRALKFVEEQTKN
ncbi:MAG: alpha/beta fold hydrolase [Verrucomicrobia bacterium]|nr:alpha/beta fold hydrolase [Verrucomicrobiota bacterium]MDA1069329.1 alpha/beta fold hydrolase [Verrucomicrobiota bacterium]